MPPAAPPFSAFRFQVWFTENLLLAPLSNVRMADAGFSEVSGLEATVEVKPHPEGGQFHGVRQLVGRTLYTNLTLKRGMSRNLESWRWFHAVASGVHPVPRKNAMIQILDTTDPNVVVACFQLYRVVPVKMKISDLNAKGGELIIEELQLAHEGLEPDFRYGVG